MNKGTTSKTGFGWLLKMAWRDGKASGKRLLLFMASIVLGIAAVVAIQSFGENLKDNIGQQSKALMGADFIIDSNRPPNERVERIIDSLGGADAKSISFPSMATLGKTGATKLVSVKGVEGPFPFYGELETDPARAAKTYQADGGTLVDATLMLQYGLVLGDSISIGKLRLPIVGSLISAPGNNGLTASVAPAVLMPYNLIESTGLVQVGSRIDYDYYFVAQPGQDLEDLDEILDPQLDAENADLDTHLSTGRQLGRRYDNFGKFLNIVAFIALLLGCVGVASSVHIYIKEKLRSVAVLKCIGATRRQTFSIFLVQILAMGLFGGLVGSLLGVLLQQVFPLMLKGFLPFEIEITFSFEPIIMGLLLGVFMSGLFALSPLLTTWYVSPLQALRIGDNGGKKSRGTDLFVVLALLGFIFVFAQFLLDDWKYALSFVTGVLVVFAILSGMALLVMNIVKKKFPHAWGFTARQSLLNLFRPNNQTLVLVLAIGVGTFLVSTLYFTKDILLDKTHLENNEKAPNLILMDVQTDQRQVVAENIEQMGLPVLNNIPIVTMRVQKIKDRAVSEIRKDSTSTINTWVLNHEFRVTYRDSLIASETLGSGSWPAQASEEGVVPISLSDNVARDAQVDLGDRLVFNVQGVPMETEVVGIRTVDWGRMQLNFNILFPTGVLENAPQFHVLTAHAPNEGKSAEVQRALVSEFPTISIIDLRQVLTVVEGILDKISWVINFMAFFSILTGIIVLIGAVRTSKYQRIKESVLLRTLGAKGKQITQIAVFEYLYLGLIGTLSGVFLALLGSGLLALFVFKATFVPSVVPFVIILPFITLLVMGVGVFNNRSVLSNAPLKVLRKEVS
ncbi:ABC transporter permease [Pseudozobellia thermophila]|uniref:Putative ABC transport system permease protein n=1 Tax=Pseudozobellia thermophila TaxID=192903 RepID=A0A1M6HZF3_9FLAO|nr:FtsX-like permease family protein [Pseudozobellia thermophila]SHJ27612.1 putative ABC transport system permease protein [Pseudozobellia thermophila]